MCGVCGIAAPGGTLDPEPATASVRTMLAALAHRGPDDSNLHGTAPAILGATRLAIRGLSDGLQPIIDPASGVVVVCNGEIDNHRELREWLAARDRPVKLATDVAVIPGLYAEAGEAFVERLVGAFAIALWDPRAEKLLLARDRVGERPLFYQVDGRVVRFATEIGALATHPGLRVTLDSAALAGYLRFGYFTAPATPFVEVRKVAPAEIVVVDAAGIRQRRYWRWQLGLATKASPSLSAFDAVFRNAVRRQMDVEVECGVFLSGGLDSSLIATVARQVAPARRLRCYTVRFEESSYDEGAPAERVARSLGLEWTPVRVTPERFPEDLAALIRRVGEPLADPAWLPTAQLARRAAEDVKVALVGEGADELFGGYPTYLGARLAEHYLRLPRAIRASFRAAVMAWPPSHRKVPVSYLLKRFVASAELEAFERHRVWTSSIPPDMFGRLGIRPLDAAEAKSNGEILDAIQRLDLETALAEGLLTKADRASMSSGLELRAPFLDQAVLEFAATLPLRERVRSLTTKVFLKRFACRYLPRDVVFRRKRGLSVPLARWLRGPLREWARLRLADSRLRTVGIDPSAALALFDEHCRRRTDHARALWTLIVLSEWLALGPPFA